MKALICFIAIIALTTQGNVGVNTPWGGVNVGWKKAAEDLPKFGVNTPFGGLNVGWKKAADLGIGSWFSCLGSAIATGTACTVGEVMTAGADTLLCAAGVAGTAGACSTLFKMRQEDYLEMLVSIGVSTPWGIGGNVSWKKA